MSTRPAVHQVLATLGYGDAIGHEVLGIQRVLRRAGYRSDIFVETADPRLEQLTRDYRELVDATHPDNLLLHHFSIGSKASRTAYALPDRMALIYHNITPPEYFAAVHRTLARQCFRGRREIHAYVDRCEMALGDYVESGSEMQAKVSADLLTTIFTPYSPLHDGAVILRGDTIIGAGCILPLSQAPLADRSLGTRHRAAIGLSQETDAVVIVVSEETSTISVALAGRLTRNLTPAQVRDLVSGRSSRNTAEHPVAQMPA